jgi:hypothetical protein
LGRPVGQAGLVPAPCESGWGVATPQRSLECTTINLNI